jgi:hypothetical protein
MWGTAWQCITCGPTQVDSEAVDVPERLAKLLEEEYKRVVWEMIYPGSDGVSRVPPAAPGRPHSPPLLLHEVQSIARKRLRTGEGMHKGMMAALWALYITVAVVLLDLLVLPKEFLHRPFARIAMLFALACVSVAVAGFMVMLIVARIRRRRLGRVDKNSATARSPTLKIQPTSTAQKASEEIQANIPSEDPSQAVKRAHEEVQTAPQS